MLVCKGCNAPVEAGKDRCPYCNTVYEHVQTRYVGKSLELTNASTLMRLGNYADAYSNYQKVTGSYPEDWRGWWGRAAAYTENFSKYKIDPPDAWIRYMRKASADERKAENEIYSAYKKVLADLDIIAEKEEALKKAEEGPARLEDNIRNIDNERENVGSYQLKNAKAAFRAGLGNRLRPFILFLLAGVIYYLIESYKDITIVIVAIGAVWSFLKFLFARRKVRKAKAERNKMRRECDSRKKTAEKELADVRADIRSREAELEALRTAQEADEEALRALVKKYRY